MFSDLRLSFQIDEPVVEEVKSVEEDSPKAEEVVTTLASAADSEDLKSGQI